ncbi:MAG: hypothetical protein H8D23_03565 [Candidatus Brocadiales bacterium]|nr:hypothetical protein [Candidatus Brocadiales bacterium]
MSDKYKLNRSRDGWKVKAVERNSIIHYQTKEIKRIKAERTNYKMDAQILTQEVEKLKAQQKNEHQKSKPLVINKEDLIDVALQLYINCRISFRATNRVLEGLSEHLGIASAPCTQTIINWVTRLSIARIRNACQPIYGQIGIRLRNGKIWMIDISIGLGAGKILAILELDAKHYILNGGAPTLQDVKCVAVAVAPTWTGITIAEFLEKVMNEAGIPDAILKDGGADLGKGVRVLNEEEQRCLSIDDLSHVIANLFKHEYEEDPMFNTFLSACGKVSTKLKQTALAFLAPPKVSTKARFMNLHQLVTWADNILAHSPRGRVKNDSLEAKLRANLDHLPECKIFIKHFIRDAVPMLACQEILKKNGLSQNSYTECQHLIETIPQKSSVRIGFQQWADKHLVVAAKLGLAESGLPPSTDILESAFGTLKQNHAGTTKDAYRMALLLPVICGEYTKQDVKLLERVSTKDLKAETDGIPSLTQQRRYVLPNPGTLNEIKLDELKQTFELMPRAKNQSKNHILPNISVGCDITDGPATCLEKDGETPLEIVTADTMAA